MTTIDRDRLAEALERSRVYHDGEPLAPALCTKCKLDADAIADEYDRLTAEWQQRMRSVNIDSKALPTRRKG